ncbi:coenzyme F420-0:L-glutamate ligase [Patescibacteria group bacterium]|nr:coenzyme F420-0:L-glutamate ligase [Patescibacteria group bacterium]
MIVKPIKTRVFLENEDLVAFIKSQIKKCSNGSVIVITSKIVALSEGRVVEIKDEKTREKVIKQESQFAMRTKYTWLTIRDNMVMSSAGVDESNANGKIIMLPKNSFLSAQKIRKELMSFFDIKNLGILITDSRLVPLRNGITGVAMGYAGFKGIKKYKGTPDIFGRKLKLARTDMADSLAAAAVIVMGEGREQIPLAVIEDAPVEYTDRVNKKELEINIKEDLYQPLFEKIKKIRFKR